MTEPEAWREIARRIVEGEWEDGKRGLCRELWLLHIEKRMALSKYDAMQGRIKRHLGTRKWAYPAGTEPEARALAALWLALEAEEENA